MKKLLLLLPMVLTLIGCSPDKATNALENSGYKNIHLGGTPWLNCDSKSDSLFTSYSFIADNSQGKTVEGDICCGLWLKGCTVRF